MWKKQLMNILSENNLRIQDAYKYTSLTHEGFKRAVLKETMKLNDMIQLSDSLNFSMDIFKKNKILKVEEEKEEYVKNVKKYTQPDEEKRYLDEIIRIYEDRIKEMQGQIHFLQSQIERNQNLEGEKSA